MYGLSGKSVPSSYLYADVINQAAISKGVSPIAMYAIAWRETLGVAGWIKATYGVDPADFISFDGGHGVFQLTASYPPDWNDVLQNALYAIDDFYEPYLQDWLARGYTGTTLLQLAADDYNAGDTPVDIAHKAGRADSATTGGNYGSDVVLSYNNLLNDLPINTGR